MLDRILFATPFDDDTNVTRLLACRHVVNHCPRETGESYSSSSTQRYATKNTRANILQFGVVSKSIQPGKYCRGKDVNELQKNSSNMNTL